jgi:hypothetical protein
MLLLAAARKNSDIPARQQLRKLYSSLPIILFQRQDLAIPTSVEILYRVVSEFLRGETKSSKISSFLNTTKLARRILQQVS